MNNPSYFIMNVLNNKREEIHKNQNKLRLGVDVLDKLLDGGIEKDIVTTVYGPAASGKTTVCILATISASKYGKVIFIDTEGGFSVERLKQLTPEYEKVLDRTVFLKPTNFVEQKKAFENLNNVILSKDKNTTSLIVVDTISMLYRVEKEKNNIKELNHELGLQLNLLNEIARKKKIPVLITNQVYADFENKDHIKIVGGDIIKYASKCMIELETLKSNVRRAILIKHRSLPMRDTLFEIREKGLSEYKKSKGFQVFN